MEVTTVARKPTPRQKAATLVESIRATLPHTDPVTGRQVLENAIALLSRPKGWTKNTELDPQTGAVCLLGALHVADSGRLKSAGEDSAWFQSQRGKDQGFRAARKAVQKAIQKRIRSSFPPSITGFNDTRRWKAPVVQVLNDALAIVED